MRAVRPSSFGELLRTHRLAAGLSQDELAERAGLSGRGVQGLERGVRRTPRPGTTRRLAEALGLDGPARAELVRAGQSRPVMADAPVVAASPPPMLPTPLTSFVGRNQELTALRERLAATRLLTLVGPGGVGKTRLALEVAAGVASRYADGVRLVDLTSLTQPEQVLRVTAEALGLRLELDRQAPDALTNYLARRHMLLVVDNCEHLIDACAELLLLLLRRCPNVHVLATSREPLGVDGEMLWRLNPLDQADAVHLFVERACAQRPEFDPADTRVLAHVCAVLDHLPLAIELAAARVRLMQPAELLPHLENRFAFLRRVGGRGASPRQQTLLATIDWSYDLLEPAEQRLFRRLAVFTGPFGLAAANALGGPETLDVLGRLVDKSLIITQVASDATRYRLLDSVRTYALERLREAGEEMQARHLHLSHLLGWAESLHTPTETMDGPTRELDRDLEDLRAVLEWSETHDPQAGLRLIGATRNVWWRRSCAEGRAWAYRFLDRCPEPTLARARALFTAGALQCVGDLDEAHRLLSEARDLAVRLGGRATVAMLDDYLGFLALRRDDPITAAEFARRALENLQDLAEPGATSRALHLLGSALLTQHERREEARHLLEDGRRLAERCGDRYALALAERGMGLYWRWTGHPDRALACFQHGAELLHQVGEVPTLSGVLFQVARLLSSSEPECAAVLAGAGLASSERVGMRLVPREERLIEHLRAELAARLGPDELDRAWAMGERLSIDEAVAVVLDSRSKRGAQAAPLSARELQVAELVSRGLSNSQIAEVLCVSPRTVDNHLHRMFTKLNLSSRLQLAVWYRNTLSSPSASG